MKTKTQNLLPKRAEEISNGGLYSQRVRCGKTNCKCARGEHHTAFYFFTRRSGKLIKFYVRKAEIDAFAAIVNESAFERRRRRQAVKSSGELLRTFRANLLQNDGLIKQLRESNGEWKNEPSETRN